MARFTAPHALLDRDDRWFRSSGMRLSSERAGVVFPTRDPRPTRLTFRRSPNDAPLRAPSHGESSVEPPRPPPPPAFVKMGRHVSVGNVFHRTMAPERLLAEPRLSALPCLESRGFGGVTICDALSSASLRASSCDATRVTFTVGSSGPARFAASFREQRRGTVPCDAPCDASHGAEILRAPRATSELEVRGFATAFRARTSIRLRGFHPSHLAGRCSAPVSLGVARLGATFSFDFCRNFDRGHEPIESIVLAHPCRAGARQSHRLPEGKPWNAGRCRTPGSRGAWLPMQQLENASRVKSPREGSFATARRSPFDDRRAYAGRRARGEESDATSDRAPPRKNRRTPFVVGDACAVGWSRTTRHTFDRGATYDDGSAKSRAWDAPGCFSSWVRSSARRRDCSLALHARAGTERASW